MLQHLQNSPIEPIERTRIKTTLGDIFELDNSDDPQPKYFNSRTKMQNGMLFRIPEHQLHPQWNGAEKNFLIKTIFWNRYNEISVNVSQHIEDNGIYFDIEYGQLRLSILQDFYMNGFSFMFNGTRKYFKELPIKIKRKFENYEINIEVVSDINVEVNDVSEAFEHLLLGNPLPENNIYWNRKDEYPLIIKAFSLVNESYWLDNCINNEIDIIDILPDIVTIIYAIINYHKKKALNITPSKRMTFMRSFKNQLPELKIKISDADNERIQKFLTYLNEIINNSYISSPSQINNDDKVQSWCSLSNQTGLILYEWLENETADDTVMKANGEKWKKMMKRERKSERFMFKGSKTMWRGMDWKTKFNMSDVIAARLERVNEFYANPKTISFRFKIIWTPLSFENKEFKQNETDTK